MATISVLPVTADLSIYAGDDVRFTVTVEDGQGNAADLTGFTVLSQIRLTRDAPTVLAEFVPTIAGNVITMHLPHADAPGLPPRAVWDVQIAGPEVTTLAHGNLLATGEVSR